MSSQDRPTVRTRREPPKFRLVEVRRVEPVSPRMQRVTLAGADLAGFTVEEPAASVRVLLPSPGTDELVLPTWNGNQFLLPGERRPALRTLTPRRTDPDAAELDVDIVLHDAGVASGWAGRAQPGDPAAVSGPARGYAVEPDAPGFLLVGDETALPAISQLLEVLPPDRPVRVLAEIAHPDARFELPHHPAAEVTWLDQLTGSPPGDALVAAVQTEDVDVAAGTRVWAAGEAAAVQRIRRHLFEERGLSRTQASVRGYWKHGRSAEGDD